jgi:hypothetical protein
MPKGFCPYFYEYSLRKLLVSKLTLFVCGILNSAKKANGLSTRQVKFIYFSVIGVRFCIINSLLKGTVGLSERNSAEEDRS